MPWRRRWQPAPVFLSENSMDRGAWRAAVLGVGKSRTRGVHGSHMPQMLTFKDESYKWTNGTKITGCRLHEVKIHLRALRSSNTQKQAQKHTHTLYLEKLRATSMVIGRS